MRDARWAFGCVLLIVAAGCGGGDNSHDAGSGGAPGDGSNTSGSGGRANGTGGASSGSGGGDGDGGSGSGAVTGSGGSGGRGGSGGSGSNINVNAPTARTAACVAYMRAYCERWAECSPTLDAEQVVASCVFDIAHDCPDMLFADGSPRTLQDTLACAAAWRTTPCGNNGVPEQPTCAVAGTLAAGAECVFKYQCESRLCVLGGSSCGSCAHRAGAGETCDATHVCNNDLRCNAESVCAALEPGDRERQPQLGDACDPTVAYSCRSSYDCKEDAAGDGRCMPLPRLGDACDEPRRCEYADSYCHPDSLECVALPRDAEPCGETADPTSGGSWCANRHTCDRSVMPAVCREGPGLGEPCMLSCADDLRCQAPLAMPDSTVRHCIRPRMPGESCTAEHDVCLPGATRCEGGVCVMVEWQNLYESACTP